MTDTQKPSNFANLDAEFGTPAPVAAEPQPQQAEPTEDVIEEVSPISVRQLDPASEASLARLSAAKYGLTPEQIALEHAKAIHVQQSAAEAAEAAAFVSSHPEWEMSQTNADIILNRVSELGLPITARSLDYALHTLRQEGYFVADASQQSSRQPLRGISGRESARTEYAGDTPQFDEQAYRALPPSARREYAEIVSIAERKGQRPPSVAEYKRGIRNPLD